MNLPNTLQPTPAKRRNQNSVKFRASAFTGRIFEDSLAHMGLYNQSYRGCCVADESAHSQLKGLVCFRTHVCR